MLMGILQCVLAAGAGDSEGTFWTVILMIVLLSCGGGIWSIVKRRAGEKDMQMEEILYPSETKGGQMHPGKSAFEVISPEGNFKADSLETKNLQTGSFSCRRQKKISDLKSGLELLELSFLVKLVSSIENMGNYDVEMRKIAFSELARREKLNSVEGKVLKVYAKNLENFFGKLIQCRAITELASRTKAGIHTQAT
jgi:hypothetical protein